MKVLLSKGVTNAIGKPLDLTWLQFKELAKSNSVERTDESSSEKRAAPWFSMTEYKANHRRRENITDRIWGVVIDLDEIYNPEATKKFFSNYEYTAWTTWRSTDDLPRWRIVLPIEGGIQHEQFGALVDRLLMKLSDRVAKVDSRSRTAEQLWFLPWYKASSRKHHRIWNNRGQWLKEGLTNGHILVDFRGVRLATKPEEIKSGERNQTLVLRLGESDALRCTSMDELMDIAAEWNSRLPEPMARKEVLGVVRKKWKWLQRGEGLIRRAEAWRGHIDHTELPDIGVGLMSNEIKTAKLPPSLVGDFLYPGATMISAKMKEGKSFLAMQLAMSVATGKPFLAGPKHDGFAVKRKQKAVIIAGEDTKGGIAARFMGSIAAGHLPTLDRPDDIRLVFNDDLDEVRKSQPKVPGLALFEGLVARWYERGYRIIALDPLRVLEAALGIDNYPGTSNYMNAHARDFQTMRYYTKVAQDYEDLCILVSMHHGKNKRDHDASDPGDMIAGTTGFGAAAIATISLLPIPDQLQAEEDTAGLIAKRRELYIHGRYTRETRLLIEQGTTTGVWTALGAVADEMMDDSRRKYFEALMSLGGSEKWISAEQIAKASGMRHPRNIHKVLNRARRSGSTYLGWKLMIRRGPDGGYRLTESSNPSAYREQVT